MKSEMNNFLLAIDMPKPRTEKNNLSYCTVCNTVYESYWAFQYGRQEVKHHDMPTYGLDRKDCQDCVKR